MSTHEKQPLLSVVRGGAGPEEIAALTAVLAARAAAARSADEAPAERPSGWRNRARGLRTPLRPGPGAWRTSAR